MNKEDIIRMAREAGWTDYSLLHSVEVRRLEQFANLVAAHEREQCERLAWDTPDDEETGIRTAIALAIRARGES